MRLSRRPFATALLLAFCLPSVVTAQATGSVREQADLAYRQREFGKSAELYIAAARLDADGRAGLLYNAGCGFALAGKVDESFATLDQAINAGFEDADHCKADADLDSLHSDPRWPTMLERIAARAKSRRDFWTSPAMQTPFVPNLSADEKVAGLSKLWSEAKFNFIYFDKLPGLDWDALYMETLPKVRATTSTLDYYRVLQAFAARLRDGHSGVWFPRELSAEVLARPLLETARVEGRVVVLKVADQEAREGGIVPGVEIVEVDGVPATTYADRHVVPYLSASTPQDLEARSYGSALLAGPMSRPVELTLRDASGATVRRTVARRASTEYWKAFETEPMTFRMLEGNVAYVALGTFEDNRAAEMFEAAFSEISKADALVIDVRENGGGNSDVGYRVLACLSAAEFQGSRWSTRVYRPAFRAWGRQEGRLDGQPETIAPNASLRYSKPVVVLAGPRTFSAAEDFLVAFRAMRRGSIVGEPSGGSTGQPLAFPLPGGGGARVCTKADTGPDGLEFVGVGVKPDQLVLLTLQDIRAGRDGVLEAALRAVRKK